MPPFSPLQPQILTMKTGRRSSIRKSGNWKSSRPRSEKPSSVWSAWLGAHLLAHRKATRFTISRRRALLGYLEPRLGATMRRPACLLPPRRLCHLMQHRHFPRRLLLKSNLDHMCRVAAESKFQWQKLDNSFVWGWLSTGGNELGTVPIQNTQGFKLRFLFWTR